MSDGSIIFDTKIKEDGFNTGTKSIKNKFGGIANAIEKMSKTAKKAFEGVSSKELALNNQIDKSKNKIEEYKAKISEIENKKIPTEAYSELQNKLKGLEEEYTKVKAKEDEWRQLGVSEKNSGAMKSLVAESDKLKSSIEETNKQMETLSNSGKAYTVSGKTAESTALKGKLESEENNYNVLNTKLEELKKKEEEANSAGNKLKATLKSIATKAATVFTSVTKKLKNLFANGKNSGSDFAKNLLKIGNMLKARILRSIVNIIINGIKKGFNNLVQYSYSLNQSVSTLKSSFTQLGNALATAVAPAIQAIMPIIQNVINGIIEAINVVSQFTSRLFNNSNTFTRAKKINEDYAKSLDKTNKKQSKFASFDTVEQLNSKDDDGSVDPSEMFEEAQIDNEILNFSDMVKASIENGDWQGLARLFGNKINGIFNGIDFSGVGTRFGKSFNNVLNTIYSLLDTINWQGIGSKIATFLNSSFESTDFNLLGSVLAKKIKIAVDLAYGFVTTFDFSSFGLYLSDLVNGWFGELDWSKIGETITLSLTGLLDTCIEFFENVDWASIGNDIYNLISNIDIGSIINKITTLAMDLLYAGLLTIDGFFNNIWESIAEEWKQNMELTGGNIFEAFQLGLINVIVGLGDWLYTNVAKPVFDGFRKIFGIEEKCPEFSELGNSVIGGFLQGIGNAFVNILAWLDTNICQPFVDAIKKLFGIHSPSTVMAEIGDFIVQGLLNGISDKWTALKDKVGELCSDLVNKVKNFLGIHSPSTVFSDIGENITAGVEEGIGNGDGAFEGLSLLSSEAIENMKTNWLGIGAWFRENVTTSLVNTFEAFELDMSNIFNGINNLIKSSILLAIEHMNILISSLQTCLDQVVITVNKIIASINATAGETGIYLPYAKSAKLTQIPIPKLATGAVIPSNYGEFAAILGDNKRETEVVSPLSTMKEALVEALNESGGQNVTIKFEESSIGDLVRILKPYFDKENRRVGSTTRVTGGAY